MRHRIRRGARAVGCAAIVLVMGVYLGLPVGADPNVVVPLPEPPSVADPLTPLTPNEVEYLSQARQVFAVTQNEMEFRSDGELLVLGRYACDKRAQGLIGVNATTVDPVLNQLAFIHLCP